MNRIRCGYMFLSDNGTIVLVFVHLYIACRAKNYLQDTLWYDFCGQKIDTAFSAYVFYGNCLISERFSIKYFYLLYISNCTVFYNLL